MRGNAKSLKRNDEARKGILIAPSKLPRVFLTTEILSRGSSRLYGWEVGFGPKFRGTDGTPTLCPWSMCLLSAALISNTSINYF